MRSSSARRGASAARPVRAPVREEALVSTSFLAASAAGWGVLMALSPVLQIRAILRRGSSHGVSIAYFAVLCVGFCLCR